MAMGRRSEGKECCRVRQWHVRVSGRYPYLTFQRIRSSVALQLVPELLGTLGAASVTQIAQGRQKVLPSISIPDSQLLWSVCKWFPPLLWLLRLFLLLLMELNFAVMDTKRGEKTRKAVMSRTHALLRKYAPKEYGDALEPAFPFGAQVRSASGYHLVPVLIGTQRNIWDRGYVKALKNPKFKLKHNDGIAQISADSVKTKSGETVKADVIIFCTVR